MIILDCGEMAEIIQTQSNVQCETAVELPVILDVGRYIEHHDALVEVRRGGVSSQIDDRAALIERVIGGKVQDVQEVEVWSHQAIGEVIQILLTIYTDASMQGVAFEGKGQIILIDKIILRPTRWAPLREAIINAADVVHVGQRRYFVRLIAGVSDIGHACFVDQSSGEGMEIVELGVEGGIWIDVGILRPSVGGLTLSCVAKEAEKNLIVSFVQIMVKPQVTLKAVADWSDIDSRCAFYIQ